MSKLTNSSTESLDEKISLQVSAPSSHSVINVPEHINTFIKRKGREMLFKQKINVYPKWVLHEDEWH